MGEGSGEGNDVSDNFLSIDFLGYAGCSPGILQMGKHIGIALALGLSGRKSLRFFEYLAPDAPV